eukprot:scpid61412/ scgid8196/ 
MAMNTTDHGGRGKRDSDNIHARITWTTSLAPLVGTATGHGGRGREILTCVHHMNLLGVARRHCWLYKAITDGWSLVQTTVLSVVASENNILGRSSMPRSTYDGDRLRGVFSPLQYPMLSRQLSVAESLRLLCGVSDSLPAGL